MAASDIYLDAAIRAIQEKWVRNPSNQAWEEASFLAGEAKIKAFLAHDEEGFAIVKSLLNQSFAALPQDSKRKL
ncbi:hypothetical protein PCANC_07871 [Puccinia coronata f. sp. avenae]|uniref:Uncharacterized protein n=1 Tax=Puccinia coronata f. sp. avenae TaxID=200324 RepID=A0A2N5VCY7_9BASI|nr:hypothetical protein PCANC_07871 [Puccinia coronata f. sp. avenae]